MGVLGLGLRLGLKQIQSGFNGSAKLFQGFACRPDRVGRCSVGVQVQAFMFEGSKSFVLFAMVRQNSYVAGYMKKAKVWHLRKS